MADRRGTVAAALLEYQQELLTEMGRPGIVVSLTPDDAANDFVLNNPNAFLFAVIFDQGIVADRAWAAPYYLKQRLGHLDIRQIAAMSQEALRAVVASPPALHRYVNNVPEWIIAACRRLLTNYEGSAENIWNDNPRASDLIARLMAFKGIGQKKAAMATQLLARDMHLPVRDMFGSQVAYDGHIRRVFLRTGLTAADSVEEIQLVAMELSPDDPGALDIGAWYVGRTWCRPLDPDCNHCRLKDSCAKLTDRGIETGY